MKKILIILILFFGSIGNINAETKRIVSGNKNAKITIRSTIITKPIIFDRIHEFDFIIQ